MRKGKDTEKMSPLDTIRVGIAQMNSTVGDFEGNFTKIVRFSTEAKESGCDIVVFPELALCGYPPEDLIYKKSFLAANHEYLTKVSGMTRGIISVVGYVNGENDVYNAAAVISDKEIRGIYHKMFLPNYGVFDEERYFKRGATPLIFTVNGQFTFGVSICEDIWHPEGPACVAAANGAELIINLNASPYHMGKSGLREQMLASRCRDYLTPIVYANLCGGQDELVFDGHSLVLNEEGAVIVRGRSFTEELIVAEITLAPVRKKRNRDQNWHQKLAAAPAFVPEKICFDFKMSPGKNPIDNECTPPPSQDEEVFLALTTALRDYFYKNGFKKGVIGLSGGIDSALVSAIAVEALGRDNVITVFMPSMFTSEESGTDARRLAENLGIKTINLPIMEIYDSYLKTLQPVFNDLEFDSTEENIQARIRGNIMMALSNKFGWLVITTGNKSEMSTGYATLYGDMAGGFALLKDVPKTLVYNLCRHINNQKGHEVIPSSILTKAPTAELRPDQKDQDTLPPYDLLDRIITAYVENDCSKQEIINFGIPEEIVSRTIRLIDLSEYKRRQSPPGVKITPRAFGKDRRMPITNRFKE